MKNNTRVIFGTILVGFLICFVLMTGCTGNSGSSTEKNTTSTDTIKSGSGSTILSITGSTTVLPIAAKAAEEFMKSHPNVDVQVNGGGTGVGVQAAGEGTAMLGMASRDLKAEEVGKYPDLIPHQIAIDGLVFITNSANPIPSLTIDQVKKIYDGNITNWKDVGGNDGAIIVVGRDSASGTREYMSSDVMKKADFVKTQLEKNSNGAVKQTVEQTPNAIGYVGLGYVDSTIHAVPLSVNGTAIIPSIEAVKAGKYPLSRPLHLLTKGEATGDAAEFLSFLNGQEGQKIITEEGFVTITR
jgi:phosphate transport system substrate-binding protein